MFDQNFIFIVIGTASMICATALHIFAKSPIPIWEIFEYWSIYKGSSVKFMPDFDTNSFHPQGNTFTFKGNFFTIQGLRNGPKNGSNV